MGWLDDIVDGTRFSESPARYFWWSGIAVLSAVVKKQIYLNRHFYKLYPNVYVALISARSGLRKGVPIALAKSMLEAVDCTRIISGCNSIQGLTYELSMQKTFESGQIMHEAQGILLSDEFESFLTQDERALTVLTALQNTHEHGKSWKKTLKGSPVEELKEPCLTLLIASNEALFDSVVKKKDIEGGFIARTFIVHESQRRMINSLMYPPEEILDRDKLIARLHQIKKLKGEVRYTEAAKKLYDSWYRDMCHTKMEDRTGTMERLGDQVIKVSMLISVADNDDLVVDVTNLQLAIDKCEECIAGVKQISMGNNSGNVEQDVAIPRVMKALITAEGQKMFRRELMNKTGLDSLVLDRALRNLEEKGLILPVQRDPETQKVFYQIDPGTYETYLQFKREGQRI